MKHRGIFLAGIILMLFFSQNLWGDWAQFEDSKAKIHKILPRGLKPQEPKINIKKDKVIKVAVDIFGLAINKKEEKAGKFDLLQIPGWATQTEVGLPAVPIKPIMIEIPEGVNPRVMARGLKKVVMENLLVYPAQAPDFNSDGPDKEKEFKKNEQEYSRDTFFPQNTIFKQSIVYMRNHRILIVEISPVQFNPRQKRVQVYSQVNLEITLEADKNQAKKEKTQAGLASPDYDSVLGYDAPAASNATGADAAGLLESQPLTGYMIIADDQFRSNAKLQEFIRLKKEAGYDVRPVYTSTIPAAVPGAPSGAEVVSFMRGLADADYPTYLLVIGDADNANGVAGIYYSTSDGGYTDLDMSCRTSTDWIPDLFCGRLPAANDAELTSMLTKVIEMDINPPRSAMYDKIVVAGQIQDSDYNNVADRLFCETADGVAAYFEQDAGGINYDCVRAVVNPDNVNANCLWQQSYPILWAGATGPAAMIGTRVFNTFVSVTEARTRIFNNVNSGIAILQHRDHGSVTGWGDPAFSSYDITTYINNGANRPLVMSVNCLTGSYHEPNSFAKAWLTHANGGAYAVLAATDVSYSGYNDWLTHGMYMSFLPDYRTFHNNSTAPDWTANLPAYSFGANAGIGTAEGEGTTLGKMLFNGKMYMVQQEGTGSYSLDTMQLFHIFGDPAADIRLHTPADISASYPAIIPVGTSTFTVVTGEDGCRVALYSELLGVHQVQTTSGGQASFELNIVEPGSLTLTITKWTKRVFKDTIDAVCVDAYGSWQFNELSGNTVYDASVNRYDGTLAGAARTAGVKQGGIQFDGLDDYLALPEQTEDAIPDCTISLWVKWLNPATSTAEPKILEFSNGVVLPDSGACLYLTPDNEDTHTLRFGITTAGKNGEEVLDGNSALAVGEWTHLALSFTAGTCTLYRNGEPENTGALTTNIAALHSLYNWLGKGQSSGSGFDGLIDEFIIYNRVLSQAEIRNAATLVNITATAAMVSEAGTTNGEFTLSRLGSLASALTVSYTLSGSATGVSDYQYLSGEAVLPSGVDSTAIQVIPVNDTLLEGNETVIARLAAGSNYQLGNNQTATVIIDDDESSRRLTTAAGSVTMPDTMLGASSNYNLVLQNPGQEETSVGSLSLDNSCFSHDGVLPIKIPAGGSYTLILTYRPTAIGTDTGVLAVLSDAEDNPVIRLNLNGRCTEAPALSLSPAGFNETLDINQTVTRNLTIQNTGGASLQYSLLTAPQADGGGSSGEATKPVYPAGHYREMSKGEIDTREGSPVTDKMGGPDGFGYRWLDSDEANGPVFSWNDISSTGTLLPISNSDDSYSAVPLGFNFPFYGNSYNTIYVSSNGYITLGSGSSSYNNYPLPSASAPALLIAAFMDDLNPGSAGDIYSLVTGSEVIIQFSNVRTYSDASSALTFQMVLKKDGSILFYYKTMVGNLLSATVGIQSSALSRGLNIAYNTSYVKDNLAVLIYNNQLVSLGQTTGTVPAGSSVPVNVLFDSASAIPGQYTFNILITHNDPVSVNPFAVPCHITVNDYKSITASTSTLDFGSVAAAASKTLRLSNNRGLATTVSSISFTNALYSCTEPVPFIVPAFAYKDITIQFSPINLGQETGTLTIQSDALDNPVLNLALTATVATPAVMTGVPAALSETLNQNETKTQTFNIGNTGGLALTLSFTATTNSPASILSITPQTTAVTPGSTGTITATFTGPANQYGDFSGTISIAHNAGNETSPIAVPVTIHINATPEAVVSQTPALPVGDGLVTFDVSASYDPDGTITAYAWDLDGDSLYDDGTGPTAENTYAVGPHTVGIKLTDNSGGVTTKLLSFDVYAALQSLPFSEGFDGSTTLPSCWISKSTPHGRLRVTADGVPYAGAYYCLLDSDLDGTYALNELILPVSLANNQNIRLSFMAKSFSDDYNALPTLFAGSYEGDGVSFSTDGRVWRRLVDFSDIGSTSWKAYAVDISAALANAGITNAQTILLKFQQYDNYTYNTDGIGFDSVLLEGDNLPPAAAIARNPLDPVTNEAVSDARLLSN